jgi:plasmid stabilization system protein ParE
MRPVRLRYTAQARRQIVSIYNYIADRSPTAARQVVLRIRLAAEGLTDFPRMGRAGRVRGTHEWVVRGLPYIIVYEIGMSDIVYEIGMSDPEEVLILGVFHAAQHREQN